MMSWKSMAAAAFIAIAAMTGTASAQQATSGQSDDQAGGGTSWMGPGMMGPGMMSQGMMGQGMIGPGMMSQGMMAPGMMGRRGSGNFMCRNMTSHLDGRLAFLKAELKITGAQETLWQHYADAARSNAQKMAEHCTAMFGKESTAALSLPERLKLHEDFMATQLDTLRAMGDTLTPLYEALSDPQKKAADQLMWGPMGMM